MSRMSRKNNKKMSISIKFTNFDKTADIKLNNSRSPKTVKAILNALPLQVKINRWGDELYTDETPIVAEEENARSVVELLDVAYHLSPVLASRKSHTYKCQPRQD